MAKSDKELKQEIRDLKFANKEINREKKSLEKENKKALKAVGVKTTTAKKTKKYSGPEQEIWGVTLTAKMLGNVSGSRPEDIAGLICKPPAEVEKQKAKIRDKLVDIIVNDKQQTAATLEAALNKINADTAADDKLIYAAPLMIFPKDKQFLSGSKPTPCLGANFFFGCFRNTAKAFFADNYGIGVGGKIPGYHAIQNMKYSVEVNPGHIYMYKTKNMEPESIITQDDLLICGQQPVEQVKGFSRYEEVAGPVWIKWSMFFNPNGLYPMMSNKKLVMDTIAHMGHMGVGSRRSANFGHFESINVQPISTSADSLYDKLVANSG